MRSADLPPRTPGGSARAATAVARFGFVVGFPSETRQQNNPLARDDPRRIKSQDAADLAATKKKQANEFRDSGRDKGAVRDDPVTSWAIAGAAGILAAVVLRYLFGGVAAGAAEWGLGKLFSWWVRNGAPGIRPFVPSW